jgi:hypothetical protein
MEITVPAFTPMEDSLFLTLCARALDNLASRAAAMRRCRDEQLSA